MKVRDSLAKDIKFWAAFLVPIIFGLIFLTIMISSGDYKSDWTSDGFNLFYEEFKFSIYTASLSIPLAGLYAAIFRSKQTSEQMKLIENQIRLVESQNIFNNHFKHFEEFEKYLKSILDDDQYQKTNTNILHKKIFPHTKDGNLNPSIKIKEIAEDLEVILRKSHYGFSPSGVLIIEKITKILKKNGFLTHPLYNNIFDLILDLDDILIFFGNPSLFKEETLIKIRNLHLLKSSIKKITNIEIQENIRTLIYYKKFNFGDNLVPITECKTHIYICFYLMIYNKKILFEYIQKIKKEDPNLYNKIIDKIEKYNKESEGNGVLYILTSQRNSKQCA